MSYKIIRFPCCFKYLLHKLKLTERRPAVLLFPEIRFITWKVFRKVHSHWKVKVIHFYPWRVSFSLNRTEKGVGICDLSYSFFSGEMHTAFRIAYVRWMCALNVFLRRDKAWKHSLLIVVLIFVIVTSCLFLNNSGANLGRFHWTNFWV